ncbi:MAG: Crp/Fnr family transcriptional regulator [Rubrivivax sp.]
MRALARRGVVRSYRKGRLLIEEGEIGDTIFIILAGRLRAFSSSQDDEREVTFNTYGPGEYVGEMGLDGGPRSANVEALENSLCAVIARPTLQAHMAEHPEFAFELLAKVIRRARVATVSVREMALNDVYGRLKALLEAAGVPHPDGGFVNAERLTHQELANRLGCSRPMISRVLKDLERGGHVRLEKGPPRLRWSQLPARW